MINLGLVPASPETRIPVNIPHCVYSFEEFKSTLDEYLHGRARAPARPARSERARSRRGTEELPLVLE